MNRLRQLRELSDRKSTGSSEVLEDRASARRAATHRGDDAAVVAGDDADDAAAVDDSNWRTKWAKGQPRTPVDGADDARHPESA